MACEEILRGLTDMDLLIKINVALWGLILPMLGVFNFIKFKKGGPYGPSGTYISDKAALVLLLATAVFSHFVLSSLIKRFIETICMSSPNAKYYLFALGLLTTWLFIKKSRKSKCVRRIS